MKRFYRIRIASGLSLAAVSFFLLLNFHYLMASFLHNIGMVQYRQLMVNDKAHLTAWQPVANTLQRAINLNPQNGSANLRLAGLFTLLGNDPVAEQYTKEGLAALGKPTCYLEQQDFWRLVATPAAYIPDRLLDFAHPQSRWRFETVYLSTGEIFLDEKANQKGCVARITVDHELAPNHFIWLWQEVKVKPDQNYQFSAMLRSTGIERAWMGVKSEWSGIPIRDAQTWQHSIYKFRTKTTQTTETVQFVIEAGHGMLEIDHVRLELTDS